MASGFITLYDGNNWSARWSRYDFVLEQIANELSEEGDEKVLKDWLKYLQPNEDAGDIECCWCFIKANNVESVLRILDVRRMKDHYQALFWKAAQLASEKHVRDSDLGYCINELYIDYQNSLKNAIEAPQATDKESRDHIFFIGGFEMGKFKPAKEGPEKIQ